MVSMTKLNSCSAQVDSKCRVRGEQKFTLMLQGISNNAERKIQLILKQF